MNQSMYIKQVQSLEDLRNVLLRFVNEVKQSLNNVEHIHRKISDKLQQQIISERKKLERTFKGGRHFYGSSNTGNHAESERLSKLTKILSEVEKQISTYQRMATRLRRLFENNGMQANVMLQTKFNEANKYLEVTMGLDRLSQTYPDLKNVIGKDAPDLPTVTEHEGIQKKPQSCEANDFHIRDIEHTKILEASTSPAGDDSSCSKKKAINIPANGLGPTGEDVKSKINNKKI